MIYILIEIAKNCNMTLSCSSMGIEANSFEEAKEVVKSQDWFGLASSVFDGKEGFCFNVVHKDNTPGYYTSMKLENTPIDMLKQKYKTSGDNEKVA